MERIEKPLITVVGATSKQGRSVVNSLMQSQRFRVRALTRRKDSPQALQLQKAGAELWEVDPHRSPDALAQAFEGSAGAFLMTPPSMPGRDDERMLGLQLANAAATAGVGHIVFSTLENVEQRSGGTKYAPHFTDKAKVADHIRSLGVSHTFVMLAFFYTNLLEYYVPRMDGDTLLMPIYLPEDFRGPWFRRACASPSRRGTRHRSALGAAWPMVFDYCNLFTPVCRCDG